MCRQQNRAACKSTVNHYLHTSLFHYYQFFFTVSSSRQQSVSAVLKQSV